MNTDLLGVVDELTKPRVEHVAQRKDTGEWIRTHTVELPALLERMHDAVWPTGGNDAGSKSTPDTRSPVDVTALFEYAKMTAAISSWCLIQRVKPTRDPVKDLRAWYVATLTLVDFDPSWYLREVTRWRNIINAHLEPGKQFEAKAPCPICGATGWGDMFTGGSSWPIEIRYRVSDDGRMTDEAALCRACKVIWVGHESIMELAEELNEKTG